MRVFSHRLKELRQDKKLSMFDLAKLVNTTHTSICRWENGDCDIKSEQLITLAKFFGVTTDYLLGLED